MTKSSFRGNLKNIGAKIINYKGFGLVCSICILLLLFGVLPIGAEGNPHPFYSFENFSAMLSNNSIYGVLAVGVMMVLLTGGIDISIGSTLAVSAVTTAKLANLYPGVNPFVWVLLAIVVGALCGFINGFLIGKLKIVPLIATLGTMYAYRGLAFLITNGEWFIDTKISDSMKAIAKTNMGFDSIVWIMIGVIILAGIFLTLTKPGRRLYAVGTNEQSAIISGINTGNIKLMAYTICGALAGLSGILFVSNDTLAHSEIALNYEMTAIAICVIGGVANTGGKGRIDCLTLGFLFMTFLSTLLSSLGDMTNFEDIFKGVIILGAVVINITSENIKQRRDILELAKRL